MIFFLGLFAPDVVTIPVRSAASFQGSSNSMLSCGMKLELCCLLVPPYFSASNSCDPSKEPFPAALYTLRPSPESLQSCRSLSLLAGVHFLPAAVMS